METLIFTVNEGRVETIAFQGKKIMQRKIRVPGWANFGPAGSGNRCISIAAVGALVLLGDYDGNLIKWDMESGKTESIFTDAGPVRRIFLNTYLRNGETLIRVAILSATWKCCVYDLDDRKRLMRVPFFSPCRFLDIAWMPSLNQLGVSTLLVAVTEEGNIVITEVDPPSITTKQSNEERSINLEPRMKDSDLIEEGIDALRTNSSVVSTLILPKSLSLFIRLMLQVGVPLSILETILMESNKGNIEISKLEDEIWAKLPIDVREGNGGFGQSPHHMTSASVPLIEENEGSQIDRISDERGFNEARKRTRRRPVASEVSQGMSLASEVCFGRCKQDLRVGLGLEEY